MPPDAGKTKHLAETLVIHENQINIKFTTTEGLGDIGEGKGIGAMCVVLLDEIL